MAVCYMDLAGEAKRLLSQKPVEEVTVRGAISKAYYAFYHCALNYADSVAMPPVSDLAGPTHKKLQTFFCSDVKASKAALLARKKIGYTLKAMHELRCNADYDLDLFISLADAEAQIIRSDQHIDRVLVLEELESAERA